MDWIDLATRLGAPVLFIFLVGRWFGQHGWPFVTRAWDEMQTERRDEAKLAREERRGFLSALEAFRTDLIVIEQTNRATNIETRNMFLSALDDHKKQLVAMSRTQEAMAKNLENGNGHK